MKAKEARGEELNDAERTILATPAEQVEAARTVIASLEALVAQIWKDTDVPAEWDATILVGIPKPKSTEYRGISLISHRRGAKSWVNRARSSQCSRWPP